MAKKRSRKPRRVKPSRGGGKQEAQALAVLEAQQLPEVRPDWLVLGLTVPQHTFALEYLQNGFNARAAYLVAHPGVTMSTAGCEGHRTLNLPKVRRWLNTRLEAAWKGLAMSGEEALGRIALQASQDADELFDERNKLKPVKDWPLSARVSLRSVIDDGDGGVKVTFESSQRALTTILQQTGKLKSELPESLDALADAIRADRKKHGID